MDNILMKRKDAAAYLGVTTSTVANYISRGILTATDKTGLKGVFVTRESVENLKDKDIVGLDKNIETLRAELSREQARYQAALEANRDKAWLLEGTPHVVRLISGIIDLFADDNAGNGRSKAVVRMVVEGMSLHEIANTMGMTKEGVRKHVNKAVAMLAKMKRYREFTDEIDGLRREIDIQRHTIERLAKDKKALADLVSAQAEEPTEEETIYVSREYVAKRNWGDEIDYVRAANCIKSADNFLGCAYIANLALLCQLTRADFIKIRHSGSKTAAKVDEYLARHGLHFGMGLDDVISASRGKTDIVRYSRTQLRLYI